MEKGKKKPHIETVQSVLRPYHVVVYAFGKENFSEERLLAMSNPSSASHTID